MEYVITTFYTFTPLEKDKLSFIKGELEEKAEELSVFGLLLIAEEGINATLAGSSDGIEKYEEFLVEKFGELMFKRSPSDRIPFKVFKVKIKKEIVGLGRTDINVTGEDPHLSPDEWSKMIEEEDVLLIDVRNWYETKLGTFKNAIDPKTWKFSQFPEWLKKSKLPKDKKIGIFCTGGIRCDKAVYAMKEQGYDNVYQLDGGILNYIEKRPNEHFEGECFVFDQRTAVDQNLKPSEKFGHCPHCGNAGDLNETCVLCEGSYKVCEDCIAILPASLCSKDCRYRYIQKEKKALA